MHFDVWQLALSPLSPVAGDMRCELLTLSFGFLSWRLSFRDRVSRMGLARSIWSVPCVFRFHVAAQLLNFDPIAPGFWPMSTLSPVWPLVTLTLAFRWPVLWVMVWQTDVCEDSQ